MKIAFVVTQFPLLSETFISNQITGLIDYGHNVDIFARKQGNILQIHEDVKKYNLLDKTFFLEDIYSTFPKRKLLRYVNHLTFFLKYLFIRPLPVLNSINLFKYGKEAASLKLFFQIVPFLGKGPYDIIHCHFGPNGKFVSLLKDIGAIEGKLVTTFHGYDMSRHIKNTGNNVYSPLFASGDLFLPISKFWKNKLIELGCDKKKIIVHRMGIDTDKFAFTIRKPQNDGKAQLLTIARLVEKKGLKYGIKAVAKVVKKHPNIEYKIIGDGPLKDDLEVLIKELNITGKVKLLGWKQQEDVVELLKNADILLAPSVMAQDGDQEGIPVVLMEALAQGLPVISTYHSGIPELVEEGVSGFLVPERDVDALSDRLMFLLDHPGMWVKMGKEGRKKVEESYNINRLNEQLVGLYKQLLDGNLT